MATISIVLPGETPSKKNSRINTRSGRSFPSKKYTEWHKTSLSSLENLKGMKLSRPCNVFLRFVHGDLRRRDSDNGTSSVMDLLVDAEILADDNWQIVSNITISNSYEKNNARCEVRIFYE